MARARKLKRWSLGLAGLLSLGTAGASAQEVQEFAGIFHRRVQPDCPNCRPTLMAPVPVAPQVVEPAPKKVETPPAKVEPKIEPKAFTEPTFESPISAALGESSFAMAAPQMMGDCGGSYCLRRTVFVPVSLTTTTSTTVLIGDPTFRTTTAPPITSTGFAAASVCTPVASRAGSGIKIGDNDSPIPTDRVFFTYNYFNNMQGECGFVPASVTQVTTGNIQLSTTTTTAVAATVARERLDVNREIFGFEKTFLGGDASIELRVPIFQSSGETFGGFNGDHYGDMTLISKFALINDPGRVFSVGLAVTLPTGPDIIDDAGRNINSVLWQPFIGFLRGAGDFYALGFSSIVVPSNSNDTTLLFNDLSLGYRLYRGDGGIRFVTPVIEGHLTTPLENHDSRELSVPDIFSMTGGLHIGFGQRAILSIGVNVPLTGPRPYDVEALAQLNYHF
jgi:hypothetical protein